MRRRHAIRSRPEGGPCPHWEFYVNSTPNYLSETAVTTAVVDAMNNIPQVNNDCGFGDYVSASQQYDGPSNGRTPEMDTSGCHATWTTDGHNVVGFKAIPSHLVGLNCQTYVARVGPDDITHADIGLDTANR